MDFPRLQFAMCAAVLLAAQVTALDTELFSTRLLMCITALSLLAQMWWILPYTFLWPREVERSSEQHADRQISILTSNVLTPNRNADALLDRVNTYAPDVLVTLESDQWWEDRLKVLEKEMPYSIKCPLDNLYGMHVFSRLPLADQEISYLVEKGVPSIHVSLELPSGDTVRAHFIHPAPPSPTENTESSERDAELVIVARSVVKSDLPVIVTGDFNDVAWSATTRLFRKISGLLDPRVGRGALNTFHVDYPFLRWPLDHVFHSQHFTLDEIRRLPSIGSDHFPLLTRLSLAHPKGGQHRGIDATAEEYTWARQISEKQDVTSADVPEPGETSRT